MGFLSVLHLVDIYAKNTDERGQTFMCERNYWASLFILEKKDTSMRTKKFLLEAN